MISIKFVIRSLHSQVDVIEVDMNENAQREVNPPTHSATYLMASWQHAMRPEGTSRQIIW